MAEIAPEILKQFISDYASVALRVRDGNDKVSAAWLKIQDYEKEAFDAGMEKIQKACRKLERLCLYLECIEEAIEGQGQCLYLISGKKARQCTMTEKSPGGQSVETFCWICPSAHPYWQEEWSEFNKVFGKGG